MALDCGQSGLGDGCAAEVALVVNRMLCAPGFGASAELQLLYSSDFTVSLQRKTVRYV